VGNSNFSDETLLIDDDIFLTPRLLRKFMKEARKGGEPVYFASAESLFVSRNSALQGITKVETTNGPVYPYRLAWLPNGRNPAEYADTPEDHPAIQGKFSQGNTAPSPPFPGMKMHLFRHKERHIPLKNVEKYMGVKAETAFSLEGIVRLAHWSHILTVNMLAFASAWADFTPGNIARAAWKVMTTFPPTKSRLKRRLVFKGKGTSIHPLANVEFSILGDNVKIGPFVNVFASYIGDGAVLDQHVSVTGSFIGGESVISNFSTINASVLFPRVYISQPGCQWSVLGELVKMTPLAQFADMIPDPSFSTEVKVMHDGRRVSSGRKFLGVAIGPRSIIGTGIWGAAGLEIPAETIIIRQPHRILRKMPESPIIPGVPYYVSDGTLKPLTAVK
jgi:acetyltransferase-like isoleucine patch superfamily enzyme